MSRSSPPRREAGLTRQTPPREVSAGKNSVFYYAHSYPTKIPSEAIRPFIECFTEPGDMVLDPFCGSGMTGVAAVQIDRRAALSDLSPGAVHIASNHVTPCDPQTLREAAQRVLVRLRRLERALYGESCPECGAAAMRVHTTWAALYECRRCGHEINLWISGFDQDSGRIVEPFSCTSCSERWTRRQLRFIGRVPTWKVVHCTTCGQSRGQLIEKAESERLSQLRSRTPLPLPNYRFDSNREMYLRSALHIQGIERWSDFYTKRNLRALVAIWDAIQEEEDRRLRGALMFAFTNTAWHSTRMRRYNARGGQRPLTGTLYIPQLSVESDPMRVFAHQLSQAVSYYEALDQPSAVASARLGSATDLAWLSDGSVDYVFTDPPFGSNIFYADCNFVWEAWLGETTDSELEIVFNRALRPEQGGKVLEDYAALLKAAFAEIARVLKSGAWASIVFHNSDDEVWRVLQEALEGSGLSAQGISVLNKRQWSMKGYKGRRGSERVTFFDLVVHTRKAEGSAARVELNGQSERFIERVLSKHLRSPDLRRFPERRLTQYLHSVVIREMVERGFRVEGASLADVERLCRMKFRLRNGLWYLR